MTQVPPAPADAPAPVPAPAAAPPDLSASEAAARARLEEAFPSAPVTQEAADAHAGGQAAPPAAAPPAEGEGLGTDIFSDEALEQVAAGMSYENGQKLIKDIKRARENYAPFREAFDGMDPEAQQALLQLAPTLGNDLASLAAVGGAMHPDDRAFFVRAMQLMSTDPLQAAQMMEDGIASMREAMGQPAQPVGTAPMPEWAQGDLGETVPPEQQPMTRAEFEQALAERESQRDIAEARAEILAEARDLGYDPESTDFAERQRFNALIDAAQEPGVNGLAEADALVKSYDQAIIDRFVQGKSEDAGRPAALVDAGAAPIQTRSVETNVDGREAMIARLDATLGPDPRRRSVEE